MITSYINHSTLSNQEIDIGINSITDFIQISPVFMCTLFLRVYNSTKYYHMCRLHPGYRIIPLPERNSDITPL